MPPDAPLIWIPVIVGGIVALAGIALPFFKSDVVVQSAVGVFAGLVFTAVPFIATASANKDGVTFSTVFEVSTKAAESTDNNTKAIDDINKAIAELRQFVATQQEINGRQSASADALPAEPFDFERLDGLVRSATEFTGNAQQLNGEISTQIEQLQQAPTRQ
jgi:hypothetical protein